MRKLSRIFACLGAMLVSATAAVSETTLEVGLSKAAQAEWPSVGQITKGITNRGVCTGTLIAPDLVLTAAHCVADREAERVSPFYRVAFRAGWHDGALTDASRAKKITIHPRYFEKTDPERTELDIFATDIALVELAEPLEDIAHSPVGSRRERLGPVTVMGYQSQNRDTLIDYVGCISVGADEWFLGLSCEVKAGTSGAPVFERRRDGWALVAVVVATTGETPSDIKGVALRVAPDYLDSIFP